MDSPLPIKVTRHELDGFCHGHDEECENALSVIVTIGNEKPKFFCSDCFVEFVSGMTLFTEGKKLHLSKEAQELMAMLDAVCAKRKS